MVAMAGTVDGRAAAAPRMRRAASSPVRPTIARGDVPPPELDVVQSPRAGTAKHVTGALGTRRLRDLTPLQVQAFLENLPLSTRSKKLVHKILRDAIQLAMIHGLAGRNVAAIVTATPRGREGRPSRSMSLEQAQAVLEAARGKRLYGYVILCLMTGIRTEEARALTWAHVDLDAGTLSVWRSVRAGGKTKTDKSKRTLAMPEIVTEALREHRVIQAAEQRRAGPRWKEHDLVFCQHRGNAPQRRERAPRLPGHLPRGGPGEGVDAPGTTALIRQHAQR
jgi:integrase